jgi:hypothetical protein
MDKINLLSINFRCELVELIDLRFLRTPVVAVLPIVREFPNLLDVGAVLPGRAWKLIGPLGFRQTAAKINQNTVGNMHFERPDWGRFRLCRRLRLSQCNCGEKKQRSQQKPRAVPDYPFRLLESSFHHALASLNDSEALLRWPALHPIRSSIRPYAGGNDEIVHQFRVTQELWS